MRMPSEDKIYDLGSNLLQNASEDKKGFSFGGWTQSLLNRMMDNEPFRVAALRFTDVAPTLRNDKEFMEHLSAYFSDVGGLKGFIGDGVPAKGLLGKIIAPIGRKNIKGMAKSFIAGETIDDGLKTLEDLHKRNLAGSIDILGEAVISKAEAEEFTRAYHDAIDAFAKHTSQWDAPDFPEHDSLGPIARANLSVKLSALYEHVSPRAHAHSVEVLTERFGKLLRHAQEKNVYLHIDVEQFSLLPITFEVFENVLMAEDLRDYMHVGIVCQAYLRESEDFLDKLIDLAKRRKTPFSIRLVKGAYWDFEQAYAEQMDWPCPVFDQKEETDANFEKLTVKLINAFPHLRPCIGSHNARSLSVAIAAAEQKGLKSEDLEFQCLYGMAEPFRNAMRNMGYRTRVYCPVGEFIPGMSYLVRRLLENTANQSFLRMHGHDATPLKELMKKPELAATTTLTGEVDTNRFINHALKDFSREDHRVQAVAALEKGAKQHPIKVQPVIGGKALSGGDVLRHICPWQSHTTTTDVHCASTKDVDAAVSLSKGAMKEWRDLGAKGRGEILRKAADMCAERWDELFALQVFESGKDWAHADADIAEGIDFMRYYADEMETLNSKFQPNSVWGEANNTVYEPRGITAVIAPWNFPFAISAGMTTAALAAGNPVIYKSAEQTSANGKALIEILHAAGVPKNVLHFIPGKGEEVGAHLVEHKDVANVAFTGSRDVGLHILRAAGDTPEGQNHTKKCIIEMGGKNAVIIDSDADLDEAVPGVVDSAFGFQGQKCSACSRVIVVGSAYDTFVQRTRDMVNSLRVGESNDPIFDVNAVIDEEAFGKCMDYIAIGDKDGKRLAQATVPKGGHFVPPTVFTDLPLDSRLTTEEVFGPVLAIYKAETIEEAVEMAMDNPYKLTGGLFSRNPKTIEYVRDNFRVGNLYINRGTTGALVGRQPFGGGGLSGTGTKAGGPDYLLNFLEARVVTENTMRRGYAPKEDV
ncbi:MAG: proline dehydrogenase family protein [Pseudomonadota bacterium]|nr:proline dehydrogenase family protein [Pseudomonadota bacterium]